MSAIAARPDGIAHLAARSIMRAKPAVVKGEPRSLTKTKGEDGPSRVRPAQIGQSNTTGGTTIVLFPAHAEQTIVLGCWGMVASKFSAS
jgi:hypothetical protein